MPYMIPSVISVGREHSQDVETSGRKKLLDGYPVLSIFVDLKDESKDCMVRSEGRSATPRREIMREIGT